jgi:hypothetical protein
MRSASHNPNAPAIALAIFLLVFAAFFRVLRLEMLPEWSNFAPVMAIALCGALVLPGWLAFAVPLGALFLSDVVLNLHYGMAPIGWQDFVRYGCYGLGVASGISLRRLNAGLPLTLSAVAGNALFFYLVTNSISWLAEPAYAKTAAGWLQALTVGVPGYPPTWTFLRNSLASDLLFTGAFLAAFHLTTRRASPALATAPASSLR